MNRAPAIGDTLPKGRDGEAGSVRSKGSAGAALAAIAQPSDLLPILEAIDRRIEIDEALALRRAGRPRRSERSRKGWATRRDRDAALAKTPKAAEAVGQQPGPERSEGIAKSLFPVPTPITHETGRGL